MCVRLGAASKRAVESLSRWSLNLGRVALLAMMLLVVVDVTLRTTVQRLVPGDIELVRLLLIIVFFAGMAYTALVHGHVRVDLLVNRFSPTTKLGISMCGDMLSVGILAVLSWQLVVHAQRQLLSHFATGMLHVPMWPFALAIAFFIALFALSFLHNFFESLSKLIANGTRNYAWLAPAIIVTSLLLAMSLWSSIFLPIKIEAPTFGAISLLLLFLLIFLEVPIGAAMAIITLWAASYLTSPSGGLTLIAMASQSVASNYMWSVVPLFILMGQLVARGALGGDIYKTVYKWVGHLPGGLASATVGACGALAACVGDSLSGIVSTAPVALPEMRAYKYDPKLATACIAAGGTIGILIPPSLGFIVYGIAVEESIGRLFIAGIIPGILLTALLMLSITVRCKINPRLGPPGPSTTLREKLVSLKGSWSVLVLFLLVIGGIYGGILTPNEAGAIGAFGALVISIALRRLTLKGFNDAVKDAMQMTAMIFFIFIYAIALGQLICLTKLTFVMGDFIAGLAVPAYATLGAILLMYLILGCIMNALPALIITLPIIFPIVMALGFDPIWFGVLCVVMAEVGLITPPIGMNVFAMAGMVPDVPLYDIFRALIPFWIVMLFVVGLVVAFPQIALFLPNTMMGR